MYKMLHENMHTAPGPVGVRGGVGRREGERKEEKGQREKGRVRRRRGKRAMMVTLKHLTTLRYSALRETI